MKAIFKPIDDFIFKSIDDFKNSTQYSDITELVRKIPPENRYIASWIAFTLYLFIPFIVTIIMIFSSINLRSEIETKHTIYQLGQEIAAQGQSLRMIEERLLTYKLIDSADLLQSEITKSLGSLGSKVFVESFQEISQNNSITKFSSKLKFENLTLIEFAHFIKSIQTELKMKPYKVNVEKNTDANNLSGQLDIYILTKQSNLDD